MAKQLVCDLCKRPCEEIKAKMFYSNSGADKGRKISRHAAYTHHLDVGECCANRVLGLFNWRPRRTKKEASGGKQRA